MASRPGEVEVEPFAGFRDILPCVESGDTFSANAMIKALYYGPLVSGLLFADDSGLSVML